MSALSLFDIEAGIHELMTAWQEAEGAEAITAAEEAIQQYAGAEVRKVDGVRRYIRACDAQAAVAKAEALVQSQRAKAWESRRDRLNASVLGIMQAFGLRKLEGETGRFRIQANGGVAPVTVTDVSILPDEYKSIVVKMSLSAWADLLDRAGSEMTTCGGQILPNIESIRSSLNAVCPMCQAIDIMCAHCGGTGKQGVPGARLDPRGEHLRVE